MDFEQRDQLRRDGCLALEVVRCEVCHAAIEPGDRTMCSDGYERVYGEFVLDRRTDLYEHNWPATHAACAVAPERAFDERLPRARAHRPSWIARLWSLIRRKVKAALRRAASE